MAITIDDGYRSTYEIAYPVLRKHGFPATVFLYTDFVGAADALTWPQMKEMAASGLIGLASGVTRATVVQANPWLSNSLRRPL